MKWSWKQAADGDKYITVNEQKKRKDSKSFHNIGIKSPQ